MGMQQVLGLGVTPTVHRDGTAEGKPPARDRNGKTVTAPRIAARQESRMLLNLAKRAVETAIEENEAAAMTYLKSNDSR